MDFGSPEIHCPPRLLHIKGDTPFLPMPQIVGDIDSESRLPGTISIVSAFVAQDIRIGKGNLRRGDQAVPAAGNQRQEYGQKKSMHIEPFLLQQFKAEKRYVIAGDGTGTMQFDGFLDSLDHHP